MVQRGDSKKVSDWLWEIPKSFRADMRVPARFFSSEKIIAKVFEDNSLEQLINIATLPGIQKYALAMPDIHEGYGFPIGGVAAFDLEEGIISPGGVGYDINCGVRILRSGILAAELRPHLERLMNQIQKTVPSGVGQSGGIKLKEDSMKRVLEEGVRFTVEKGWGEKEDIDCCEEQGAMAGARAEAVSLKAKERGRGQLGTLGSGNHFLEVQQVEEIFDESSAQAFGLFKDQTTVMIHSGSRGLGHQVCTDYVSILRKNLGKFGLRLADPELACAPFKSAEGQNYFSAMAAAANFAWANRQVISHLVRRAWQKILGSSAGSELKLIYDVAHNIAKIEEQDNKRFCVHRKGATRAFGPGHLAVPEIYRSVGQPILIPGTMATASYILAGLPGAAETFFSVCHGAGRVLSRHAALRQTTGQAVKQELENKGILVRTFSNRGLAEEAPLAYKNIHNVVEVVVGAGLAKLVARLRPLGVLKG